MSDFKDLLKDVPKGCPACKSRNGFDFIDYDFTRKIAGVEYSGRITAARCKDCPQVFFPSTSLNDFDRLAIPHVARGPMTGAAFRFLMGAQGLNGRTAAAMLHTTPETVSRWCSGKRKMDAHAFVLMARMALEYAEGRSDLRELLQADRTQPAAAVAL